MSPRTERSAKASRSVRVGARGFGSGARGFSRAIALAALALASSFSYSLSAQQGDGPKYVAGSDKLIRPENYREWIFIGSSLGLNYPAPGQAAGPDRFNNVFVNPSSYRAFMKTGKWPDKTAWVLEFRAVGTEAVANRQGKFQTDVVQFEVNVKDSRFKDGWAYYLYRPGEANVAPLSGETAQRCIDCHTAHTAVERTFVQFYPTLLDVAKRMGTVRKDYTDP